MKRMLFIDIETTGLDYQKDRIIEFGALVLNDELQIQKEINVLINIGIPLKPEIINLTKITDEMLINKGISENDFIKILQEELENDTLIVAYNIQFDISFIISALKRYLGENYQFKHSLLDVMAIYKDFNVYPHRLCDAIKHYNIEIPNSHRALDDIKATLEVFKQLNLKCDVSKYINMIGFNKKYGINGIRLPYICYVAQVGGMREIEKK